MRPSGDQPAENTSLRAATIRGRWILLATILGSGMAFIDSTVVNVALPVLQGDLHATAAEVLWVVEAYALFLSALILVGGALGDRYGRKRIYAIGIALFAVASACCGLSANITELIIFRSVQGIGAALLTPGSLAIISASFPPDGRGKAIGTWSGFTAIASAIGPLVGGFLIPFSWRWIFFINVPLAAITLLLLFRHVPESRDEADQGPPDILGSLLATLGLGALVYGLISAGADGFGQPQVVLTLVIGVLALAAFFLAQMRERYPMMPLFLFRSRAPLAVPICSPSFSMARWGAHSTSCRSTSRRYMAIHHWKRVCRCCRLPSSYPRCPVGPAGSSTAMEPRSL
ncbi:MAG: MFS transporter [Ktedonobacterales bacterium]